MTMLSREKMGNRFMCLTTEQRVALAKTGDKPEWSEYRNLFVETRVFDALPQPDRYRRHDNVGFELIWKVKRLVCWIEAGFSVTIYHLDDRARRRFWHFRCHEADGYVLGLRQLARLVTAEADDEFVYHT